MGNMPYSAHKSLWWVGMLIAISMPSQGTEKDELSTEIPDCVDVTDERETPDMESEFAAFRKKFSKVYRDEEECVERFKIFAENYESVKVHNADPRHSWKKAINKFSDLSVEEFEAIMTGGFRTDHLLNLDNYVSPNEEPHQTNATNMLPRSKSIDWRKVGSISPVKDQGLCSASWAFAAVQQIESYVHIETGEKLVLSTQQINSCANFGCCNQTMCGGCLGGLPEFGYLYSHLVGVVREEVYPYTSGTTGETGDCFFNSSMGLIASTTGFNFLPHNELHPVLMHLAFKGPLSAAIYASDIKDYASGVYHGCSYNDTFMVNHAVQVIGYGTHPFDGDFWIVKNNWGEDWGDEGYIKLRRERHLECSPTQYGFPLCGMCGILFYNSYPLGTSLGSNWETTATTDQQTDQ